MRQLLESVIEERAPFSLISGIVLLWISTRLVGNLRIVLRQVFELKADRGLVPGKVFDIFVVLLGGLLLMLNVGVILGVGAVQAFGVERFGLSGAAAMIVETFVGQLVSFGSAWGALLLTLLAPTGP